MSETLFMRRQRQFTQAMRTGCIDQLTFIDKDKAEFYSDLIFSTNSEMLKAAFPVLFDILGKQKWDELIRTYLERFRNPTNIFHEVPQFFVGFLKQHQVVSDDLVELAHYEWLELYISLLDCEHHRTEDFEVKIAEQLDKKLIFNPSLHIMQYHYPVHQMSRNLYPIPMQDTFIAVYRNQDYEIKFTLLSEASAKILLIVKQNANKRIKTLIDYIQSSANVSEALLIEQLNTWLEDEMIEQIA